MIIITSDASWCPITKAVGFGCCIETESGKLFASGSMLNAESAKLAEVEAALAALYMAIKYETIFPESKILVRMDCQSAIRILMGEDPCDDPELSKARSQFAKIVPHVKFEYVEAHKDQGDLKHRIHNECDRLARNAMRARRFEVQEKQNAN